jgi:tetratricopeptide (TPR) repeat protein
VPPPEAPAPGPRAARLVALLAKPSALWGAVLLGGALRVAHAIAIGHSPLAERLILDHRAYDTWAQRIAAGDWVGRGIFWVDPLYSYVLAALYALLGRDLTLVRCFHAELGAVNIWLAGAITRRVTGSNALATVGALVAALCLPLIHNEAQIEKATLTATLACGALALLLRGTDRAAVGAGVLLGLGALARGNLLLAIPAAALALALAPAREGDGREALVPVARLRLARPSLRRAWRFTLAALAVVGVLTARNALVTGEFVLTTANAGQNLYIGQQRDNVLGTYGAPSFVRADPQFEQEDFRAEAERRTGQTHMGDTAASRYWALEALREVAADPRLAVTRTLEKVRLAFHQFETPDNDDVELSARFSWVLRLPLFGVGMLAPFALLGAIVGWRRSRETRVVAAAVALYASTLAIFFVVGRFRVPMVPPLIALAVAGAAWLVDRARARDLRRAGPAAALVAAGLALCLVRTDSLEALRVRSLAVSFNNLGTQQLEAGDVDGAMRSYERAIDTEASSVVGAMRTLGDLYLRQRRYDDAERVMTLVMEHKPGSPLGRAALVRLYEAMREDPRYRDDASVRERLATAYREAGRPVDAARLTGGAGATEDPATRVRQLRAQARTDRTAGRWNEAIAEMQEVIRIGPYDEGDRYALGELMEQRATPQAMATYWSGMVASDPKPQTSLYFWAIALLRQNDLDGAEAKLREALQTDPAHEMSEFRYCLLLERRGDLAGALRHCDIAVEIFPDFRGAHEARARLLTSLGRSADAERARQDALRSDPNTIHRFRHWGSALLRRGRYAAAAAELARAVEADPTDAEAAALLRDARAHLNDAGPAR